MNTNFELIQELLRKKSDYITRLGLLHYDGTVEIKENKSGKYLYIRKRQKDKITSTYIDKYSDMLYESMIRITKEAKELNKLIRSVERELKTSMRPMKIILTLI